MQMKNIDIISQWHSKNLSCIFRDSSVLDNNNNAFRPEHFFYLADRNFAITHSNLPMLTDDILVRLVKCEYDTQDFYTIVNEIKELNLEKREFYVKLYIMMLLNHVYVFSHKDFTTKLDLFGEIQIAKLFTEKEQETIIEKMLKKEPTVACELVHRGFIVSFDFCIRHESVGMLLYYIIEAKKIKHVAEQKYVSESSNLYCKVNGYSSSSNYEIAKFEPEEMPQINPYNSVVSYISMNIDPNDVDPKEDMKHFYEVRLTELQESFKTNPLSSVKDEISRINKILGKPEIMETISELPDSNEDEKKVEEF